MSKLDRADIQAQTDTLFADNVNGDITESDFRTQFDNLSDSSVSLIDDYYPRVVGTPTGTANAITVSTDYPDAYDANVPIWFKATANNSGAVTFKVNSLSALTLYAVNQTAITVADTLVSGRWYCVIWDTDANGSGADGFVVIQSSGVIGSGFSGATGQFDTITDQAGTGAPNFSKGAKITATDSYDLRTADRTDGLFISNENITAGNGTLGEGVKFGKLGNATRTTASIIPRQYSADDDDMELVFFTHDGAIADDVEEAACLNHEVGFGVTNLRNLAKDGAVKADLGIYSESGTTASLATSATETMFTTSAGEIGILSITTTSGNSSWRWYGFIHGSISSAVTVTAVASNNLTVGNSSYNVQVTNTGSTATLNWSYTRIQG